MQQAATPVRCAVLATVAMMLAGCSTGESSAGPPPPPTRSSASKSAVPPSPSLELVDSDTAASMGALDTVLLYCTPAFEGSPREGCDLGRITSGITEVTASLEKNLKGNTARTEYPDALEAINGMNKSVKAIKQCQEWFASGGRGEGVESLRCSQNWSALTSSWRTLKTAVHWP